MCVPFERAEFTVSRQSETGRAIVQRLGARHALVVPARQPHAVDWQRPADILSLHLSEAFVGEALGGGRIELPDTLTLRDPFVSAAARQLRAALTTTGVVSAAFAGAMATAIAFRVGLAAKAPAAIRSFSAAPALSPREAALLEAHASFSRGSASRRGSTVAVSGAEFDGRDCTRAAGHFCTIRRGLRQDDWSSMRQTAKR